jgi:hypothetical protein
MPRCCTKAILAALLCLLPALSSAQGRVTGQINGTVKDSTGAVVPKADLVLIDNGTGATVETKSGAEGNFVFPNLQPGRYQITATFQGFNPVTVQEVIVETARSVDLVVQFQAVGVTEQVTVEGRTQVVETTSTTVANTVSNAEISKLPLAGRNILNFALLTAGGNYSAGARDSEYNGLPGGAINITLDGVNNNSARFRSGGTSFFTFAPVRMGAIEEITVSTAGLTADAGAEGAVQIQFVTKRGTNAFRGQVFDQISNDKLNANSAVNAARALPKTKLNQHEWGANFGGPILKNKLFFFANYEQIYSPSESTQDRTVLTDEAQRGIFRYNDASNVVRTVNLFDVARGAGLPSAIDPFIAAQFQTVNAAMQGGNIAGSSSLFQNTFRFLNTNIPNSNIYPTGRVDYQVNQNLAIRGVLNLQWRDLARNPQYPTLPQWNAGFTSTYYILSTGFDWTLKPNLFYQMSFGGQSNFEEFNPGNTIDIYAPQRGLRIAYPQIGNPAAAIMASPEPTNDVLPIPRNNPVWNVTNTLTWLKGKHTYTFGGTFRRTTMYESIGGAPPTLNLGVASGDPASSAFTATTIPGIRSADLPNAIALYGLLSGRINVATSGGGVSYLDENTKQYRIGPAFRREAQNVGGVYLQDQWRLSPKLTLNYGLRWEFSGAATNPNEVYSSPELADLFGPSTGLFQPGVLGGVRDPQVLLRPTPYKSDWNNPAPNVGVAWHPDRAEGILGKILGDAVYRGNFGVNYYDEGLINFQTAAGNGPGLVQTLSFPSSVAAGSLNLQSTLPAFVGTPTSFSFPIPMSGFTFSRGHNTIDPNIQTPYVKNWTLGYQRELWRDSAIEIRYVGNRGSNLWRSYNINETNIIENNFLQEFRNAQRNLQIANNASFANQGLPGQVALPIFEAAFGARGSQPAVPANSGFTNGNFITWLQQGQAGRLANTLAGSGNEARYLCAMVGNTLPACASRGYNVAGPYAINFFQANPFGAGANMRQLTDESSSKYDALQIVFRKRYTRGFSVTANYTYGKSRTDRYTVGADGQQNYRTLRDKGLDWGPTAYDLRHAFNTYWTYDLPFGRDRAVNIDNALLNQVFGGWSASGVVRVQTGRPFLLTSGRQTLNQEDAGVILNGITVKELQQMVNVRAGTNANVFVFDERLIGADGRANTQFLSVPTTPGVLGEYVYLYGPGLWSADLSVAKNFNIPGGQRFNFEALFINAFNHRNVLVGGTGGATLSIDSTTFGQTTTAAIGARQVQFRLGFYF